MHSFTLIFLIALTASVLIELWLAKRHITHIQLNRNAVPSAFTGQINLAAHQKAADYSSAKTRLGMIDTILGAVILLALTFGGALQAIYDFWTTNISGPLLQNLALIISTMLIINIIHIPLSLYRTFSIEARYGFNRMTVRMYFSDLLKQLLLSMALGVPLLALVLWLMEKMGTYWWLYVWLVWAGFNLIILAVYPTFIAPLFNKFSPLTDSALKDRIEQLIQKCGFKSEGVFVMDNSKRSSHGNAYFTGFGASKRIVLFDTLISRLNVDEIEAILAHELGHFKKRHVLKRMAWIFAGSLGFLALLGFLIQQPWFYQSLNVSSQSTGLALILFFMVIPVFTFLLHPLMSLYSRKHEFEADQYATHYAKAEHLIRGLVKLYEENAATLTPDPLHSAFYDSHPPALIRIQKLQHA